MKSISFIAVFLILFVENAYSQQSLTFSRFPFDATQRVTQRVLTVAYQRLGISIDVKSMPGKRALRESSEGRTDGEVHRIAKIEESYPTLIRVPIILSHLNTTAFSKDSKMIVSDCNALKNYRIGIVRGAKHAELCTQGLKQVIPLTNSTMLFQFIEVGRADVVIIGGLSGIIQLKKLGIDSVHPLSPPLRKLPLYHFLHQKHKALVPKIYAVLKKMKDSGELEEIQEKATKEVIIEMTSNESGTK